MKKFILNDNVQKILASLTAILIGFIFGFLILLFAASIKTQATNPIEGFITIITGGMRYNGIKGFGIILRYTTPVLLTGLSVGFAFKTGLFNIGAAGHDGRAIRIAGTISCDGHYAKLIGVEA